MHALVPIRAHDFRGFGRGLSFDQMVRQRRGIDGQLVGLDLDLVLIRRAFYLRAGCRAVVQDVFDLLGVAVEFEQQRERFQLSIAATQGRQ